MNTTSNSFFRTSLNATLALAALLLSGTAVAQSTSCTSTTTMVNGVTSTTLTGTCDSTGVGDVSLDNGSDAVLNQTDVPTVPPEITLRKDGQSTAVTVTVPPMTNAADIALRFLDSRTDEDSPWMGLADVAASYAHTQSVTVTGPDEFELVFDDMPPFIEVTAGGASAVAEIPWIYKAVCQPQCTTFVASTSGIDFSDCWDKTFGNAGLWFSYADQCGFRTSRFVPKTKSIMEFSQPGHVLWVTKAKLKAHAPPNTGGYPMTEALNIYEVAIEDRNWDNKCGKRKVTLYTQNGRAYTEFDPATKTVGGRSYKMTGFITRW